MKIYDLSKEFFSAQVYPGDPIPQKKPVSSLSHGDPCNLTGLKVSTHNSTHMDAPSHFIPQGKTIDQVELSRCIGPCKVVSFQGRLEAEDVAAMLEDGTKRLLIAGDLEITEEAARVMTQKGLLFLGVEGLTVGPLKSPAAVHRELLSHEVAILEAACMDGVREGNYLLCSAPVKYGGVDGAPCRPVLMDLEG